MVDQASPKQPEDLITLSDSEESVHSTIRVATRMPNLRSKRKRRAVALDSDSEESTISPNNIKSNRDESVNKEMKNNSSSQTPDVEHNPATVTNTPTISGHHDDGGEGEGEDEENWDINTSTIQGLVGLMDKSGKKDHRRRLNAERKLSDAQQALSDMQHQLADAQLARAEAGSKSQGLSLQVAEYKQVIEASKNAEKAGQEREARLKEDNTELRLQCDIKDKRFAEAKLKHEMNRMVIERLQRSTATPEEVAQLRKTIAKQERESAEDKTKIATMQQMLDEKEKHLSIIQGTFKK
ncbi:hypothetical protein PG997_008102 [Apiospora hydei]|uniref:Uncharacterized protein n=1 Tax=Apiospora hydei TaxID=1337664 RepID=A0ABR1WDM9_9PEZI